MPIRRVLNGSVFRDPGFPSFEARDPGFKSKIGASFVIESMLEGWDSKNNPRDYGIARNFGSGLVTGNGLLRIQHTAFPRFY